MTLITTEIHNHNDPARAMIVFASDRRITKTDGRPLGVRKKVFELEWLNAGIGYFGLAETAPGRPMQEWLKNFILRATGCRRLEDFARTLSDSLNTTIPASWRRTERSGFHIAGFSEGKPEFWYVRNIDDQGRPTLGSYKPREDFQRRDAERLKRGEVAIYRNGDLRAHDAAWSKIDDSFGVLLNTPGFRQLRTPQDYVGWVRFKMKLIAYFYKQFYRGSIIGQPIDAFGIRHRMYRQKAYFIYP